MSTDNLARRLMLPVGPRDHSPGPADARVILVQSRGLRVPPLRTRAPHLKVVQRPLATKCDSSSATSRSRRSIHTPSRPLRPRNRRRTAVMFWEMHDMLFEHQGALDDSHLVVATPPTSDSTRRHSSKSLHAHVALKKARVREDFMSGIRSGVNGTPTFFINGIRHDGPVRCRRAGQGPEHGGARPRVIDQAATARATGRSWPRFLAPRLRQI